MNDLLKKKKKSLLKDLKIEDDQIEFMKETSSVRTNGRIRPLIFLTHRQYV